MIKIHQQINPIQFILGSLALLLGSLVYILHRPLYSSNLGELIGALSGGSLPRMSIFGNFNWYLPTFIHPLGFALLTMALFPLASRKIRGWICLSWLLIELFFEVGQLFGNEMARFFLKIPFAPGLWDSLRSYFINGTYDRLDVLSILLGVVIAYVVGEFSSKGGNKNVAKLFQQKEQQGHTGRPRAGILETSG